MNKTLGSAHYLMTKRKLDKNGEQFILNSQIDTLENHYNELENNKIQYEETFNLEKQKTEKKARDIMNSKLALDQDIS